jgi:hypothetical protein
VPVRNTIVTMKNTVTRNTNAMTRIGIIVLLRGWRGALDWLLLDSFSERITSHISSRSINPHPPTHRHLLFRLPVVRRPRRGSSRQALPRFERGYRLLFRPFCRAEGLTRDGCMSLSDGRLGFTSGACHHKIELIKHIHI